jgi:hypothetical protein
MSILDGKVDGLETEAAAELARLRAENDALRHDLASRKSKGDGITVTVKNGDVEKEYVLSLKVSEKGAVSIYGTGRFPITAYPLVWLAILSIGEEIKAFILKNTTRLSWVKLS